MGRLQESGTKRKSLGSSMEVEFANTKNLVGKTKFSHYRSSVELVFKCHWVKPIDKANTLVGSSDCRNTPEFHQLFTEE